MVKVSVLVNPENTKTGHGHGSPKKGKKNQTRPDF